MKAKLEKVVCGSLERSSILKSFYPLLLFAQICGFCPLQHVLAGASSVKKLTFQLISGPVLYSIILNLIFYSFSFEATWDYWIERRKIFKFSTDAFAIQIFLAVFLFLRFTLHLLSIVRAPKVLECLKQLETYDTFYNLANKTTLLNKYLAIYLLGTTVNIVGNVLASFPGVWGALHHNFFHTEHTGKYLIYHVIPSPEFLAVLVYGIHVIAEAALFFSHCCITFIITGVCDRVTAITEEVLKISKDGAYSFLETPVKKKNNEESSTITLWMNQIHSFPLADNFNTFPNNQLYGHGKSILDEVGLVKTPDSMLMLDNDANHTKKLKILCSQYTSLVDISRLLNDFAKETVAVFTAGSTVVLVALFYLICILLTQYVPVSSSRIKETEEIVPIIFIAVITFLRLLNFINIGEKLRCDGYELVSAIHRLHSFEPEVSSVIVYFQQVTAKLQLNLSAGGFFIVRRTVITSILGPVLTFIVILAQFRAADLQLHYNSLSGNGTVQNKILK